MTPPQPDTPPRRFLFPLASLILVFAAVLRAWGLGRLSFWYDEVVTVRLARSGGPATLLRLLNQIDATRAPLHPLLLQGWVGLFGPSEASARLFSAACGVATVALVGRLGRRMFSDDATGLWAAALAAVSPWLVYYSREARMYAWLVLVTCAAWDALWSLGLGPTPRRLFWYALTLTALVYSHPLGLLMASALALASLLKLRAFGLTWPRWWAAHALAAAAVAPWLPSYFDHPPESTVGRLPWKFLLGTPIGFLGGNFWTLAVFVVVIAFGLLVPTRGRESRFLVTLECPAAARCLLSWLIIPPTLLYAYSCVAHPVFGPARYTLFVAPAYLILLARGLARLPVWERLPVAAAALGLAAWSLPGTVYAPDLKADWRAAAAFLDRSDPSATGPVVVVSADPGHNVEVETARYYLGPRRPVVPMPVRPDDWPGAVPPGPGRVWFAVGLRGGRPAGPLPDAARLRGAATDLPGLRLNALDR
jgi:mannosyltransferase